MFRLVYSIMFLWNLSYVTILLFAAKCNMLHHDRWLFSLYKIVYQSYNNQKLFLGLLILKMQHPWLTDVKKAIKLHSYQYLATEWLFCCTTCFFRFKTLDVDALLYRKTLISICYKVIVVFSFFQVSNHSSLFINVPKLLLK